jgi:hypothetical protein
MRDQLFPCAAENGSPGYAADSEAYAEMTSADPIAKLGESRSTASSVAPAPHGVGLTLLRFGLSLAG